MEGLYKKYIIEKADGSAVDPSADYLVLRLDKDKHALVAALRYATEIEKDNPQLAKDIIEKFNKYVGRFN